MKRTKFSIIDRLFGSPGGGEPLDFKSLMCQEVPIDDIAEHLSLSGKATSNGKEELPSATSTQLDGPQSEIKTYFNGRVETILSNYEQRLKGLNQKIASRDIPAKVLQAQRMDEELRNELRHLRQRDEVEIDHAHRDYVNYERDYTNFKHAAGILREPHIPDSKGLQWSLVVLACLLEALVNAFFYYQGLESGIAGGVILALILAVVDISILFFVGRGAAQIASNRIGHKVLGGLLFVFFLAWATGYNLITAHIREQLQGDVLIRTASELALTSILEQPFGLTQADSWVLFAFGAFFSIMAFSSGFNWDEKIPGYGKRHRELKLRRDQYYFLIDNHRENALELLKAKRKELDRVLKDAKTDLDLLKHDVQTKETLLSIVTGCIEHNTDSCKTLVRIYRDENLKARSTQPPDYFDEPIGLQVKYPERHDPVEDLARIAMYAEQLEGVRSRANELQRRLDIVYQHYLEGLDLNISRDLDGAPPHPCKVEDDGHE